MGTLASRLLSLFAIAIVLAPGCATAQASLSVALDSVGPLKIYRYTLDVDSSATSSMADILINISGSGVGKSEVLGSRGTFLFSVPSQSEGHGVSHPPIWVGTPDQWISSVYYTASLSWSAHSYGSLTYAVRPGQSLGGFEIRSPALMAMRRYAISPYNPLTSPDAPETSAPVVIEGYILAPGWTADEITPEFVSQQIEAACAIVDRVICSEMAPALNSLDRSWKAGDYGTMRYVLTQMRQTLAKRDLPAVVRRILDEALVAMMLRRVD